MSIVSSLFVLKLEATIFCGSVTRSEASASPAERREGSELQYLLEVTTHESNLDSPSKDVLYCSEHRSRRCFGVLVNLVLLVLFLVCRCHSRCREHRLQESRWLSRVLCNPLIWIQRRWFKEAYSLNDLSGCQCSTRCPTFPSLRFSGHLNGSFSSCACTVFQNVQRSFATRPRNPDSKQQNCSNGHHSEIAQGKCSSPVEVSLFRVQESYSLTILPGRVLLSIVGVIQCLRDTRHASQLSPQ